MTWKYAYPDGSTAMRIVFPKEDNDLLDCERIGENLSKEQWLNNAIGSALDLIGIRYDPLYRFHSFIKGQHRADFGLYEKGRIEAKNWNCVYYLIGYNKVDEQILPRFDDPDDLNCNLKPKICVISMPKWDQGVRDYSIKKGVILIELGYFVTINNYSRAVSDLCKHFKNIGLNQDDFVEKYWQEYDIYPFFDADFNTLIEMPIDISSLFYTNILHQNERKIYGIRPALPIQFCLRKVNYIILSLVLLHRATEIIFNYYTYSLNPDCPEPLVQDGYVQSV